MGKEITEIPFVVQGSSTDTDNAKGLFSRSETTSIANVSVARLRENLRQVSAGLAEAMRDIRQVGDFRLTEVTVEAEVNAEGSVSLLGTGGKAGGKGAITLKFVETPKSIERDSD